MEDMRSAVLALAPHAADYSDEEIEEVYDRSILHLLSSPALRAADAWEQRQHWKTMRQIQRAHAAEQGLCMECGTRLYECDGVRCPRCTLQQRGPARERARRRAAENRTAGLCSCGQNTSEGYQTCTNCRARARARYEAGLSAAARRKLELKRARRSAPQSHYMYPE